MITCTAMGPSRNSIFLAKTTVLLLLRCLLLLLFCSGIRQGFAQKLSLQTGHASDVTVLQFSPDGQFLASGSADNSIVLWDNTSGKQFVILSGHNKRINAISFHPTEQLLASASDDKTVRIWAYPSGELLHTFSFFDHGVKSLNFDPSGQILSCGSDSLYLLDWKGKSHTSVGEKARDRYYTTQFSPNGKYVAFGGKREYHTSLVEIAQPKHVRKFQRRANDLSFDSNSEHLFVASNRGKLSRYKIDHTKHSPNFHIAASSIFRGFQAVVDNDQYFIGANRDHFIYVYSKENGKRKHLLNGHFDEIMALAISPDGQFLASSGKDRYIVLWNLKTGSYTKVLSGTGTRINSIAFDRTGDGLFIGYNSGKFRLVNIAQEGGVSTERAPEQVFYKGSNEWTYAVQGCNDYFVQDSIFVKLQLRPIGLQADRTRQRREDLLIWHPSFNPRDRAERHYQLYRNNRTDRQHSFALSDSAIHRFQVRSTVKQRKALLNSFRFSSPPPKVLSVSYAADPLNEQRKVMRYTKVDLDAKGDFIAQSSSPSGEHLATLRFVAHAANRCEVYEVATGIILLTFDVADDTELVGFSPDGKLLYVGSKAQHSIRVWSLQSKEELYQLDGLAPFRFSRTSEQVAFTNLQRDLIVVQSQSGKEMIRVPSGHSAHISDIKFNPVRKLIATASHDGFIKFWDAESGALKVNFAAFNESDFIYIDPDNHYYSSFGAMQHVAFTSGDNIYAFEQFDLQFNRPDLVMARMGNTSKKMLETYHLAYQKRIRKLGLQEADLRPDYHIPSLELDLGAHFKIETEERKLSFRFKAIDTDVDLKSINVWINDVPLYSKKGLDVSDQQLRMLDDSIHLTLSHGLNKIQLSATNMAGGESRKQTFEISYRGKQEPATLHLFAIGVSTYQDSSKNLQYAMKDANDLANLYQLQEKKYGRIEVHTLHNEEVTRENIRQLRTLLNQTNIDDEVILFYAGHGVLSKDYDYFLSTYDMDFSDPTTGMPYSDFIDLLDGIPARKKLVLLDACHSGEVDKESLQLAAKAKQKKGKKRFRAAGNVQVTSKSTTFEVMQNLFADLRRGAGAHVISSAGGTQYAQESDDWGNGIFTGCLLEGLKEQHADLDRDGAVTILELQEYLKLEVYERTNGEQKPNARVPNYANNYTIWLK